MTTLARLILTYLCKLSCGHIRSQDTKPVEGELEWCNMCGDFKVVVEA